MGSSKEDFNNENQEMESIHHLPSRFYKQDWKVKTLQIPPQNDDSKTRIENGREVVHYDPY